MGAADLPRLLQGQGDRDGQVGAAVHFPMQVPNVSSRFCLLRPSLDNSQTDLVGPRENIIIIVYFFCAPAPAT